MATESPRPTTDHSGVWFPPPLFYVGIFLIGLFLQRMFPLPRVADGPGLGVGIVLFACGVVISLWSIGLFRRMRTSLVPIKPTNALVETGTYGLTRNPMYLGLLAIYTGMAMLQRQWWPILLIPVVILVINLLVIRKEELYLERRFGEDFLLYKRRVRRWV